MKGLTDVPGILVGHATDTDALTGCTVILCGSAAVGGVDVRGSATGSCELETLNPGHVAPHVHAIVLAGGSAFGIEASSGVRRVLEKRGIGFNTGVAYVPIVPGAILYDLSIGRADVRPGREMGEKATLAANDGPVPEGNVGAGTGATVGKIFGMKNAMKSGIGSASLTLGSGVLVAALVVVNALGDVIDPSSGRIVAGARKSADSREYIDSAAAMRHGIANSPAWRGNTTLAVVATDAALDRVQTNKIAALASLGVARSISPVNTMSDGDITFALSVGKQKASVDEVGVAAAEALSLAVLRAVKTAKTAGGVPGLAG
ncbi:MAG TPA: P1 family peptidase [Bryobacteraceae bacterium]|nr:P1 family peptidase [Bryobacteraceae bacterium]